MKQDKKDSFMKNITLNLKHFVLLFILAMFSVTASAVNVTYSLKTHTGTQRTIEGTANLTAGADLKNNMPQALWRAYCEYTFYSDEDLTQEITKVPTNGGTVYVDYVFDPPFILSKEGKDPVWHYLRSYNAGGTSNHVVYYKSNAEGESGQKTIRAYEGNYPPTPDTTPNGMMSKKGHAEWAFYGDAYDFHIKVNDSSLSKQWLIWTSENTSQAPLRLGEDPSLGWQLYTNTASNRRLSSGTVCLGVPETTNYLASLENMDYYVETDGLDTSKQKFNGKNQLVNVVQGNASNKDGLWWYAFFATPVSSTNTYPPVLWHVTYKIQKADGTWYDDIVIQKNSSNLNPSSWPVPGFTPVNGCEYDYYYTDATFTEKFVGAMPNDKNTTLYIKETKDSYVATPWRTLVLPYSIPDLNAYFGENGVRVLEYTSVEGELNGDAFRCNLVFTPVDEIVAYRPYLFKADRVKQSVLDGMCHTVENMENPEEIKLYDNTNAPNIGVSMLGVLADGGYPMPDDGLNFFFGSMPKDAVDDYDNYTYKFYRVGATIPQFVCYFFVTDERTPSGAPIRVSFGTESITGVSSVVADVKVNNSIYSLDGRKVNASSLDNLKRGIYIINGRKVVK